MLKTIDAFWLDKVFEPLSVWIYEVSGIGVYTLARWLLLFAAVGVCVHGGIHGFAVLIQRPFEIIASVGTLAVISICAINASGYEERYHKRLSQALPPNLRAPGSFSTFVREISLLNVFLTIVVPISETPLLMIVDDITYTSFFFGMYFLACTPRPPKRKPAKLKALPV